jgi:hypothetical protein
MPASSEKQRRAMCAALAVKRGAKSSNKLAKKLASDMSEEQLKDFCSAKESFSFKDFLELVESLNSIDDIPAYKRKMKQRPKVDDSPKFVARDKKGEIDPTSPEANVPAYLRKKIHGE